MSLFKPVGELRPLRGRQLPVIPEITQAILAGHKRIMIQAPTGYGKTVVAAHLMERSARKGKRPLFVAPAIQLVEQTLESFEEQGLSDIGIIQAQHQRTDWRAQIQIASRDTLVRRKLPEIDFAIVDEAHDQRDAMNAILDGEEWKNKIVIGLSATPWSRGLGLRWTKLIIAATMADMIADGAPTGLSPFKCFSSPIDPDMSRVKKVGDDYNEAQTAAIMSGDQPIGDAVETWLKHRQLGNHPGDRTFLYGVNRAHARALMEKFQASGISCGYIDGETPAEQRKQVFARYRSGEDKVLCNVGVLITGVDEDVRCIDDCAPTQSEIRLVQRWGRGARLADGKAFCIARDSLVLTDHGLVKIQDVSLDHRVWDGVSWVEHGGAICRGIKAVIEHDGIVATPDHEVMTHDGFQRLADAKRGQRRIITGGLGRFPIRITNHSLTADGRRELSTPSGSRVHELRQKAHGAFLQYAQEAGDSSLSTLQPATPDYRPGVALRALRGTEGPLREPVRSELREVRWSRDTVSVFECEPCGALDSGESRDQGSLLSDRQNQQRWTLRAGELEVEHGNRTAEQHPSIRRFAEAAHNIFSGELSRDSLCGSDSAPPDAARFDGRGDHLAMGHAVVQAEREVWDILNAGPLQMFTVNGRIVHNCLGLDHAGNLTRLGAPWDIHHDTLDTRGPKDKGEAYEDEKPIQKPRKCQQCYALIPPKTGACPSCGFVYVPPNRIEHVAGELTELRSKKKPTSDEQAFLSGLLMIAYQRNFKGKWVDNKFFEKYGYWPDSPHLERIAKTPRKAVKEFVEASRRQYLESIKRKTQEERSA